MHSWVWRAWSCSFHARGRVLDRGANLVVGPAAADVAAHRRVDVGVARRAVLREKRARAHDLARLAVAALRHVVLDPRRLHRLAGPRGADSLDGGHLLSGRSRQRRGAGAHGLTVKVHGAGTALS